MGIKHTSFKHGWFYHYRVHEENTESLCHNGLCGVQKFMDKVFEDCPDHYFTTGPRSSALKFNVGACPIQIDGHEISKFAELGLKHYDKYSPHTRVQLFMLNYDEKTIGAEVPIWIMPYELEQFKALFGCDEPLTGHIDVLRIEDGKVWVWDFKPNATKEKYAHCQVLFYCLMLSKRTGIPLEKFRAGYFDEKTAFIFKPEQEQLNVCAEIMVEQN